MDLTTKKIFLTTMGNSVYVNGSEDRSPVHPKTKSNDIKQYSSPI